MSATDVLREDHNQIKRLDGIIIRCYETLYAGKDIPFSDLEKINSVIAEFIDSIHYSREEDSYFACVTGYGNLKEEIRKFLIEHEFGRRIAQSIAANLNRWKNGDDAREPVARYLRTYSIYLHDHISKEEHFFMDAAKSLTKEEEREMYEQFSSVMAVAKKIDEMKKELDYLESCSWYSNVFKA